MRNKASDVELVGVCPHTSRVTTIPNCLSCDAASMLASVVLAVVSVVPVLALVVLTVVSVVPVR